eukprot:UN20353
MFFAGSVTFLTGSMLIWPTFQIYEIH